MESNSVKILIVEDEMLIAAKISTLLTELGYEVTGILARAEDALAHAVENVPDIALLDIRLKGNMDGVELAQALQKERKLPIIFLTANADDATFNRAKTTKPYAFISKPFKKLDLQRAIELTISRMADNQALETELEHSEEASFILSDRIFVRHKDSMVKIFLEDIFYIEADRNYCRIFTRNKEYLLAITLKIIEEKLPTQHFIRVHRSFIVNLAQIDEVAESHVIIARKAIPLSKSLREELLKRIQTI
ncbi:MAG: LytR/AlgR family response regulator transcription factor [Saprospiraceae bacterium]